MSAESSDDEFFDAESDPASETDSKPGPDLALCSDKTADGKAVVGGEVTAVAEASADATCSTSSASDDGAVVAAAAQPLPVVNASGTPAAAATISNAAEEPAEETSARASTASSKPHDDATAPATAATTPAAAGSDQVDGAVMSSVRGLVAPSSPKTQEAAQVKPVDSPPDTATGQTAKNTAAPGLTAATCASSVPACGSPAASGPRRPPPPKIAPYRGTRSGSLKSDTGITTSTTQGTHTEATNGSAGSGDIGMTEVATSSAAGITTQGEATQSQNTHQEEDFVSRYAAGVNTTSSNHFNFVAAEDKAPGVVTPVTSVTKLDDPISDTEILEGTLVKNLDTGESIPLSEAEKCIPNGVNPLALHIMRLTSEFVGAEPESEDPNSRESTATVAAAQAEAAAKIVKQKGKLAFKAFKGKVKSVKKALEAHGDNDADPDSENNDSVRFKASSSHRGPPFEYDNLTLRQDLSNEHTGPVWTIRFSTDGRLMASAGQDLIVRVWVLKKAKGTFDDMRNKYSSKDGSDNSDSSPRATPADDDSLFDSKPFCAYSGHTADILDLAWSKNYFLLSASFDKTVRLWHVSRQECLACFQHTEFVTGIAFHPRDDRYFLSGSLDARLRLWNIPDKKVALWNEVEGSGNRLITAANFVQNGKYAAAGTYDGRCLLYETEYLKYHTQIHVRSSRGKNAKGRKITGIVPMPGEDKILISSNDSRVRLYDLKDLSMVCKYKGAVNRSSQIEASFSADGSHIITGSENGFVYLWRTFHDFSRSAAARLNDFYESFAAPVSTQSGDQVTAAVFAPVPGLFADEGISENSDVLVAADYNGCIHVYSKPR
ncbi:WD repeat-containing protein 44-like [Sycon ciliatum]|uniref:WD repeat-containing protein 44-like n=1 Tax=Sycon ciliatum TaxID=27933 RepID=UPI0031F606B3